MKAATLKHLLALGLVIGATSGHAANYHASIEIPSNLYSSGNLSTPLYLDFQLNSGGGSTTNVVSIGNFTFTGTGIVGPEGSPVLSGNASGYLVSTITLADGAANPYNEFYQAFSNGTTLISFFFSSTENLNPLATDLFTVSILDSSTGYPQIPTTDPLTLSLVSLSINQPSQVLAYAGTGPASGVTATATLPAPSTLWLFSLALAGTGIFGRNRGNLI